MKWNRRISLGLMAIAAVTLGLALASSQAAEEAAKEKEKPAEPPSRVKHGPGGEVILTVDAATQKLMGLQLATIAPTELSPELKAYGRILDVSGLVSLAAEISTAESASLASQAELKRVKTLAEQSNASERAVQTAEANAVRDRAQLESARLRLLANWGGAIAERPDLPAFVKTLAALTSVLVELDLPAGQAVESLPVGVRLLGLGNEAKPIAAQLLGAAPVVDPQMQGRGFLCLINTNAARWAPGAAVSGFLSLPGQPETGVLLPRNAIVRYNGATWVYLQTVDDTFQRLEVTLARPLEGGWFVRQGLKPQAKVATVGSQQLLSEELKGQSGE